MSDPSSPIESDLREGCVDHEIRGKGAFREWDRLIAALAERQHGVVARSHLMTRGMSRRAIEDRIARGRLHQVYRGVYAVGHTGLSRRGRWLAAVLACGPNACLSHRGAAQLWQLLPWRTVFVEVTRPRRCKPRAGITMHRSRLPDDERTEVDGIPVTSMPRTILDLGSVLERRQLERAINEVEVRRLTDALSVPDLLERYRGRRGTAVLRAIFCDREAGRGVTANTFEDLFADLVAEYRLTPPRFNADVAVRGRFYRVDVMWKEEKIIVELDGQAAHGTRSAFEDDRQRDRLLLLDGWRIVRITWIQLRDQPEVIAGDLRELLGLGPFTL